ncbi:hypothetical protein MMC22_004886 [Lobaria immixta]|nr:hypothetical protein [Lobaria immixta]
MILASLKAAEQSLKQKREEVQTKTVRKAAGKPSRKCFHCKKTGHNLIYCYERLNKTPEGRAYDKEHPNPRRPVNAFPNRKNYNSIESDSDSDERKSRSHRDSNKGDGEARAKAAYEETTDKEEDQGWVAQEDTTTDDKDKESASIEAFKDTLSNKWILDSGCSRHINTKF